VKEWTEVTFFGLQYFLKEYLVGQVVTPEKIAEAYDVCQYHFGATFIDKSLTNPTNFNKEGWEYILQKHGGRLPVRIKAVPEGMTVPLKTVLLTVENTWLISQRLAPKASRVARRLVSTRFASTLPPAT
jgi:nicotinamide phosphoribosyltransferase